MTNKLSKSLCGVAAVALFALAGGSAFAADPVYVFKKYAPGLVGNFALTPSSSSLSFGPVVAGHEDTPQTLTLLNTGTSPISFASLTAPSGFAQTNNCGFLQPGAGCQVTVTFAPPSAGAYASNFVATYDGARQLTVALSGTGTPASAIGALLGTSLAFGSVQMGSNGSLSVSLSNTGGSNLAVSSITSNNAAFTIPSGCTTVAPGASCAIGVLFTPTGTSAETGTLTVVDNAAGSPRTVSLSGTGLSAIASLSGTSVNFGSVNLGATSTLGVQITNTGNQTLSIDSATVDGSASFTAMHNCSSVAPGAVCTANITFSPVAPGSPTGTLSLVSDAPGSPHAIALSGSAAVVFATWNPAATIRGTLSNGNLDFTAEYRGQALATVAKTSGKYYWEVPVASAGRWNPGVGVCNTAAYYYNDFHQQADCSLLYISGSGTWYWFTNGSASNSLGALQSGDILGYALDIDSRMLHVYLNGTLKSSHATPATGALMPAVGDAGASGGFAHANFGQAPLLYTPAGYNAGFF